MNFPLFSHTHTYTQLDSHAHTTISLCLLAAYRFAVNASLWQM